LRVVEIHYYRVPRERWELMILRARQSGANGVSTYIPWIHHEPVRGEVDLTGRTRPERDLVGFVELCAVAGLGFIAKPGPFCDSEMLGGGVPTWLLTAHPEWWAIRHDGEPYRHGDSHDERLSYDHPDAQAAAAGWLRSVAGALEQFAGRSLWALQIDNETPGDGMGIHEDGPAPSPMRADFSSTERWQAFLAERYGSIENLNEAWADRLESFDHIRFPGPWSAPASIEELRRWIELDRYADHQMASGLAAYAAAVKDVLGDRVPLFHDWLCMPWRLSGLLVEPGVLADTCEWVGQNVYAEDVDRDDMIAGTSWYKMNDVEYVHHAWWRTRLCHTLSAEGRPHLVPEISARQAFYLQCSLVGGMDGPCIYMLHSSEPEPEGIGAFQRWAEEAPVLPDGSVLEWWWNARCLFLCLEAGGTDLAASALGAPVAIAYDHAGERAARWAGVIDGAGFPAGSEVGALCAASNTSAAGMAVARSLVDAGIEFDVVDVSRAALDRYEVVIVPDVAIMSRAAQERLAKLAVEEPFRVRAAGALPAFDEDLRPCSLIPDVPALDPRRLGVHPTAYPDADLTGLDIGVRAGASGRSYVTVVNRSAERRQGSYRGVALATNPASVTWFALDGDRVTAALLHGDDASVGPIACSQGQCSVALLVDGSWHVISQERAWVTVPGAAGLTMWRVTLSGKVLDAGVVGGHGRFRFVHQDDRGQTDRYVLGSRAAADAVAEPVRHFLTTTLAAAEAEAAALGVPVHEVADRVRRTRSRLAAGRGTAEERVLLERLTHIAARTNDIRLGES